MVSAVGRPRAGVTLAACIAACLESGSSHAQRLGQPSLTQTHGAACATTTQEVLFPMSGGFSLSPTEPDIIVYARPDANGRFQVWRHDQLTRDSICLTCRDIPSGPAGDLHKGVPTFLRDGRAFLLQVESARNPARGAGQPGAGWFNNVWIASADGTAWRQLTDLPMTAAAPAGVLQPQVSPDGSRVAFAQLVADDEPARAAYARGEVVLNSNPFGRWLMTIALFGPPSIEGSIGPQVSRRLAPRRMRRGQFFELSAWSPDSRAILYASDAGKEHVHQLDLWTYDVYNGALANLTASDDFEEFGDYSPDGRRIIYMSSAGTAFQPTAPGSVPFRNTLATDLFMMRADGSGKAKVTDLNGAGMPQELRAVGAARAIVAKMKWNAPGTAVFFELAFFSASTSGQPGRLLGSVLVRQNFAGACGRQ